MDIFDAMGFTNGYISKSTSYTEIDHLAILFSISSSTWKDIISFNKSVRIDMTDQLDLVSVANEFVSLTSKR